VVGDPLGGEFGGCEVGVGCGYVDLDDQPAAEGLRQSSDGGGQIDLAATGFGPDGELGDSRVEVRRVGVPGCLRLTEVDVLEMRGHDAIGVPGRLPRT
jgi:hypothetical protein